MGNTKSYKNFKVVYLNESEFMPKLNVELGDLVSQLDVKNLAEDTFLVFENNTTSSSSWVRFCTLFKMNDTKTVSMIAVNVNEAEVFERQVKHITHNNKKINLIYSDFSFSLSWLNKRYA